MGNNLVFRRSSSNDSHPTPINRKRKIDDQIGLGNNMICKIASERCCPEPIYKRRRANGQLEKLPEDVLGTIISKLPLKEVVRTSVLSTKWRCLWAVCPRLSFDGITMCGSNMFGGWQQYTQNFIDNVNAVLLQHHGGWLRNLGSNLNLTPCWLIISVIGLVLLCHHGQSS